MSAANYTADICYMPTPIDYDLYNEMRFFDQAEFEKQVMEQCAGQ